MCRTMRVQVLRLTNKLRSEQGTWCKTPDELYIKADRLLDKSDVVDEGNSSKHLHDAIFGKGITLSREDKACLDSYVRYVVLLLGNDASAQAMSHDAAERCWNVLLKLYESDTICQDEREARDGRKLQRKVGQAVEEVLGAYMADVSIVQPLFQSFKKLYGLVSVKRGLNDVNQVSIGTQEMGRATYYHGDKDVVLVICGVPVTRGRLQTLQKALILVLE